MSAYVETLASTDILSDRFVLQSKEVSCTGSEKFFTGRFDWPTDAVLSERKTLTKDVLMPSQGDSDNGSNSNVKMEGRDSPTRVVTEKESSNVCLANVQGSWGSLETYSCSRNVFTGDSSKSCINDVKRFSIEKKRLIPSFTMGSVDNHKYMRSDPDSISSAALTASAQKSKSSLNSLKQHKNRLSWGEEVMIGILGKDPNDFSQLSSHVSATSSSMPVDRTNSKSTLASSDQSLKSKIEDLYHEMNPIACWKDSVRRTFFRDRNLENGVCTRKSSAVSRESFPPKEMFSPELLERYDPTVRATWAENEKVTGRPATDPSGVPKSKHVTFPQMREQASTDSGFSHSNVTPSPREKKDLSGLEEESEDKSLDSSSTRSSISKLFNSELRKEERSQDCNPSLDTPSMVSMITSSSTTSVSKSADESDKSKKDDVYQFSPGCLAKVGKAGRKEKVRQVSPRFIEPKRYLPGNCFPAQMCLQQGCPMLHPQGGPILCPQPVNGGFMTPQLSAPLICIPEHGMGQTMLYTMPNAPHMVISPPLVSPVFYGGPASTAGIYNSTSYHQTPVHFQLRGGYQQRIQRPYSVDQIDQPVRVNLPLTTENVNMHNRACVISNNNLS